MLEIEVHEIKGKCPVHQLGDKIVVDGPEILVDKTDSLCVHALASLLHYFTALEHGADPVELGLAKPGEPEKAYIQCLDPGEPYTSGGTVVFCCRRLEKS